MNNQSVGRKKKRRRDPLGDNVALTDSYDETDSKKFSLCTPKKCFSVLQRGWDIVPDSRFITDINGWPTVIDKIIAANGTKVEGEVLRTGKRYIKNDGKLSKVAYRSRNRMATLEATPIHPHSYVGRDYILACGSDSFERFVKQRDNAEREELQLEIKEQRQNSMAQAVEDDEYVADDDAYDEEGEIEEIGDID